MPDVLLALGLLLSTATQLRPGGSPIGPGEICILLWLGAVFARRIGRPITASAATYPVIAFGLVLILSESAGFMMGMAIEPFFDVPSIVHDVVAYTFLISATVIISIEMKDDRRRMRVAWLLSSSGALALLLQLGDAKGWVDVPGIDPWHFDRVRGWSEDPNQLGFVTAFLVLLAVYLAARSKRIVEASAAIFCCAVALVTGVLTKSDTFTVCIATATLVFLLITCRNWLLAPRGSPRAAVACIGLLAAPLVLAAALPFTSAFTSAGETYSEDLYYKDNQGDTRLMLWKEALEKGLDSKLVGMGPGPHLVKKAFKRPPPDKFESHNTPLELFTQGGLIASLAFIAFAGWAVFQTCRAGINSLAALSCGLLVFSLFHFVLRHPIFWFGIVLCLLEADRVLRGARETRHPVVTRVAEVSSAKWALS